MSFIDPAEWYEVPTEADFAVLDLRKIPSPERLALANILQQAVDRLGGEEWSAEREDAVMRELLRTHMRGLISDAARAGGTAKEPDGAAGGMSLREVERELRRDD